MKKSFSYMFMSMLLALPLLLSCGEDRTHEYLEMTEENQWTYSTMKDVYLWAGEMNAPDRKSFFGTTSKFFSSLLVKKDKVSFFTDSVSEGSYGFKFSLVRDPLGEVMSRYYALVLYVEPGSPAHSAGIRRGTWISGIDGKNLNSSSGKQLQSGAAAMVATSIIDYDDENEKYFWVQGDTLSMQHSVALENRAIFMDTLLDMRSGKTGYLVCRNMNGTSFADDVQKTMLGFAAADVADIIIDLRYCSEGTIENAATLASILVPQTLNGNLFATLKGKGDDVIYNYAEQPINLSDKRLFFIIGNETKGIAELLVESVNASRGMHDVIIVGTKSAGANVLTRNYMSPFGFSINPAVAVIQASDGEDLQAEGIAPDYPLNELEEGKYVYPLGNRQEYILRNLEYFIINGFMPQEQ
ncbi:MAG: hypothetical protein IKJ97_00835 [Bacteroidaceae bacterium]|nr:hypothetical protein [Bacteroidaceae bacterium]